MNHDDGYIRRLGIAERRSLVMPAVISVIALFSFIYVVSITPEIIGKELSFYKVLYAILMGLLGACLYLLYNTLGVITEQRISVHDPRNFVRLIVGPIAGWITFVLIEDAPGSQKLWLPFLAGFSSDLMVGIINQMIRAVKYTLGIEQPHESKS
ncbi:hypothetical protein [uncultured Pseudoteredinibacter sp.]|uniref:hypothetical protein n=1 Tax=uncultured Pseudoteredinibacter sp. TaxID=1641701 RepID=UPI00262C7144|nr:hypothetical protein [uncultured Pseudoteredinibacter sp.]